MIKKVTYFVVMMLSVLCINRQGWAFESQIKGDPELIWLNPLGKEDIKNNAYNRCLLIRTIKPGFGDASTSQKNYYETMAQYATNLYAQSIKIGAYLDAEKEASKGVASMDLTNEQDILENEILGRLSEISRRINIINAFEASRQMITVLQEVKRNFKDDAYGEFRIFKDGQYKTSTDCEDFKEE